MAFLQAFEGLERIRFEGTNAVLHYLLPSIMHHGKTLRVLELHGSELSIEKLLYAAETPLQCHTLQEFSLGIMSHFSGGLLLATLVVKLLRELRSLRRVSISTSLHCKDSLLAEPPVNESFI